MREGALLQTIHFASLLVDPANTTGKISYELRFCCCCCCLPTLVGLLFLPWLHSAMIPFINPLCLLRILRFLLPDILLPYILKVFHSSSHSCVLFSPFIILRSILHCFYLSFQSLFHSFCPSPIVTFLNSYIILSFTFIIPCLHSYIFGILHSFQHSIFLPLSHSCMLNLFCHFAFILTLAFPFFPCFLPSLPPSPPKKCCGNPCLLLPCCCWLSGCRLWVLSVMVFRALQV